MKIRRIFYITVNDQGIVIHKLGHKNGKRHGYDIYKKDHPTTPKQVLNVYDSWIFGSGKGFPRTTIFHTE